MSESKGNMTFAKRIKELREAKDISQEDLAAMFGYKKQAVSNWEVNGKIPRDPVLRKLADYFNTSADFLLGYADASIPQESPTTPIRNSKATQQLEKILEMDNITFKGAPLSEEDREKIKHALELAFWDAKEKNKRK